MVHASDVKPTRRQMTSRRGDEYVVELRHGTLTIRPKGTRSEKVRVLVDIGRVYLRGVQDNVEAEKRAKAKARREQIDATAARRKERQEQRNAKRRKGAAP